MLPGWQELELAGHPLDLYEPPQRHEHGFCLIYLHGVHLARLVENEVFTRLFQQHGLAVAVPYGGPCWWVDRVCPEFDPELTPEAHVRENVLPWLRERYQLPPRRVGLLGTSMGGQGALRLAFRYPDLFPAVAAIAPAIDFHQRYAEGDPVLQAMYPDQERCRQDTALLHVHPLAWPRHIWFACDPEDHRWWESSDRLHMKLASMGMPHQCDLETSAGGHGWRYYNHMAPRAVEFLVQALEQERLRLA